MSYHDDDVKDGIKTLLAFIAIAVISAWVILMTTFGAIVLWNVWMDPIIQAGAR